MERYWKNYTSLLVLLLFAGVPGVCHAEWLTETRSMMGTEIRIELWSDEREAGERLIEQSMHEFQRLDKMMNPWNEDSLLSAVNRDAFAGDVLVGPDMVRVIGRALHYSRMSHGAFDISFASVGQHYDYRDQKKPSASQREQARAEVDYRQIHLDPTTGALRLGLEGMALDLGGIAKGYAVDRAIELLSAAGVEAAVVSAGGDSRILGNLGDRPRLIGIRHPRKPGEHIVVIPLEDTAISTSGDYERFFEEDGVRYHHILDPGTGDSARGVRSASVITAEAIDSDALSTTVFVLGVERGLALVNELDGVDAIVVDGEGKLHYSADLLLSTTE